MASPPPYLLALESSCDESAVALYDLENDRIHASLISSQIELHRPHGGVVPEVASREHAAILPRLVADLFAQTNLSPSDCAAFAATRGPGLASSLLVGLSYAKGLAIAEGKPFYAISHLEGHLLSPLLPPPPADDSPSKECKRPADDTSSAASKECKRPTNQAQASTNLIVSGGHTLLIAVRGPRDYHLLGQTRDDAAGEALDKAARLLGLPYPGGPEIERLARQGDPSAFAFPRPLLHEDHLDFSFSGLKTALLYQVEALSTPLPLANLCASFQAALIDVLIQKTLRAAQRAGHPLITLSGGVAANAALRAQLEKAATQAGKILRCAPPELTGDNAAMIAFAAAQAHRAAAPSDLHRGIEPRAGLL